MFVGILSRTWWSSFVKGDEGESGEPLGGVPDSSDNFNRNLDRDEIVQPQPMYQEARPVLPESRAFINQDDDLEESERYGSRGRGPNRNQGGGEGRKQNFTPRPAPVETASDSSDDEDEEDEIVTAGMSEDHIGPEDPLAPAFELDIGKPVRPRREDRGPTQARTRVRNAQEFFATEILYRFDLLIPEERNRVTGSYAVEVKGTNGGTWSMQVGDELKITEGAGQADLTFSMHNREFLGLVNGDLNPQLAMLAQKIRYSGDPKKAVLGLTLLSPVSE